MASSAVHMDDLYPMAPIHDGVALLKAAALRKRTVFCICGIARDYHVGAKDAEEILGRMTRRGVLEERPHIDDQKLFVPKDPDEEDAPRLEREEERAKEDLERVYEILEKAYPGEYLRGKHLSEQPATVAARFEKAFRYLRQVGILPVTTGNAAFNHQGIVLLMEPCFPDHRTLSRYLQYVELVPAPPAYSFPDLFAET